MVKKRTRKAATGEAATKVAESIGEALARIVNRIEALDAERDKAYNQLLALQARLNDQVARFGKAIGDKVTTTAAAGGRQVRARLGKASSSKKRARTRSLAKCGICGTPGHNARGHAKWKANK